jgi:MFS family permease
VRRNSLAIYLIAGWSGYYVMALELLGARALSPYFGSGIYVWGAVITVFMLSLSIGYLLGGRLSLKRASTRVLGFVLLAAVASALPCVVWSDVLLQFVFDRVEDPRYGALLASIVLFFAPITLCGAISPYAVRLIVANLGSSGQTAGFVFFISTLGSTLGTLVTSFYLVLLFEVDQILIGMSVISMLVAANALRFGHEGATH